MFGAVLDHDRIQLFCHEHLLLLLEKFATGELAELPEPPRDQPLVTVTGDDPLDHLEAEMVTGAVASSLEDLVTTQDRTAHEILAKMTPFGPQTLATEVSLSDAEALANWANRRYVALRTSELNAAGQPSAAGAGELLPELAMLIGEPMQTPDMGIGTMVLAMVAHQVTAALIGD